MGRYSDSDDESSRKTKKKKKRRSRSRSRSADSSGSRFSHHSHKHKKSKKKHRQRSRSYSRSPDRHSRRDRLPARRRRSRSPDRARRSRSSERGRRSRSYERKRGSRSRSRDRRSRSDSRDRVSSRRRSASRERGLHSRSDSGTRSQYDSRRSSAERKRGRRSPSPSQVMSTSESNMLDEIPGFKDMTPAEQAQLRLKMALRAATMSTEKLKEQSSSSQAASSSPLSRQQFADAVASIESDSFAPATFKSSRSSKGLKESREASSELPSHNMAMFGAVGNSVVFTKTEPVDKGSLPLEDNPDTLFDPSLNVDPEEKMDRWIQKLTAMRLKKLEGEIIHSY